MSVKDDFMVCTTFGDISYFSYTKKTKNSKGCKSTTIQFIFNILETCRGIHECENQKLNSALSRGGLWLLSKLLWKILTITEKYFCWKTSKHGIHQILVKELYKLLLATQL